MNSLDTEYDEYCLLLWVTDVYRRKLDRVMVRDVHDYTLVKDGTEEEIASYLDLPDGDIKDHIRNIGSDGFLDIVINGVKDGKISHSKLSKLDARFKPARGPEVSGATYAQLFLCTLGKGGGMKNSSAESRKYRLYPK